MVHLGSRFNLASGGGGRTVAAALSRYRGRAANQGLAGLHVLPPPSTEAKTTALSVQLSRKTLLISKLSGHGGVGSYRRRQALCSVFNEDSPLSLWRCKKLRELI
jgi:hypothetical protein